MQQKSAGLEESGGLGGVGVGAYLSVADRGSPAAATAGGDEKEEERAERERRRKIGEAD